jgi:alpha-D-xyloside xylohydrolase
MQGFHPGDNCLMWKLEHQSVRIEPWGRDSLRVRATENPDIRDDLPHALLEPAITNAHIEIDPEYALIRNGAIAAKVSLDKNTIHFFNPVTGTEYLAEEAPRHWTPARYFQPAAGDLFKIETRFKAYDGERFYGLGQHQHGHLDQKGCVIDLAQLNTEVSIPFLLSSRGYGFLWNNPAVGRVELGKNFTRWVAEATPQLDYWITAGETPAEITEHYADATGHVPLLPEWAAGFWQCKLRYSTQEELLAVAREHKRRGLPMSVIVADFFHWSLQGDWKFDPTKWPDPAAMVRELKEMGVRLMVSIWPTVNALSHNFKEMQRRGLLVRTERGIPVLMQYVDNKPEGPAHLYIYDATHPEARQYIWQQAREGYYRHGIQLFWLDETEPEISVMHFDHLRYHLGNGLAVTNIYPLMHARGFYEGLRAEGEQDIVLLCRSAWAGSQRYGAAVWSGDIPSTFEVLQAQVRAGLNMSLSGIPWWTTDIGGFYNGDPESPYFRELIVRWFQYGAFCPLFRLHGWREPAIRYPVPSGGPNEVWSFGDEAYGVIKEVLFLRERLRPYILEQMRLAHEKGIPPMRPLFFDFPHDVADARVDDQFMFGPDLMVAPVLHQGQRTRRVYLPAGTIWTEVWTEQALDGGQWITADAPLDRIPLYVRGQVKLPIRAVNRKDLYHGD